MPKRPAEEGQKETNICSECGGVMEGTEEGPPPMKNMKPATPKPNAADQFYKDHQEEYECRGKDSDKTQQVEDHNTACPKLKDELEKRKDTTKTEVNETEQNDNQKKRVRYSNKHDHGRPCRYCDKFRTKRSAKKPGRIVKNRKRHQNGRQMCMCKKSSTQIQRLYANTASSAVTLTVKMAANSPAKSLYINDDLTEYSENSSVYNKPDQTASNKTLVNRKLTSKHSNCGSHKLSKHDISYPPTSRNSLSSYHSFMSQDHEPMVQ